MQAGMESNQGNSNYLRATASHLDPQIMRPTRSESRTFSSKLFGEKATATHRCGEHWTLRTLTLPFVVGSASLTQHNTCVSNEPTLHSPL